MPFQRPSESYKPNTISTGPISPAGSKVFSARRYLPLVQMLLKGGVPLSFPSNALAQVLTTTTDNWFFPFFTAFVMSMQWGASQEVPQQMPFRKTVAMFCTLPRRRKACPLPLSSYRSVLHYRFRAFS